MFGDASKKRPGTTEPMKSLKIVVSVVILAVLGWRMDWPAVAGAFAQLDFRLWLAALAVYALAQLLSSIRWQMLSRPLGFDRPLSHFLGWYYIGMFFNLMLPTSVGGDVIRACYLDSGKGRRLTALVSVFSERCSGLVVLLSLACAAVLVVPLPLPVWVPVSVWGTMAAIIVGTAGLIGYLQVAPEKQRGQPGRLDVVRSSLAALRCSLLRQPGLLITTTLLSLGVQTANVIIVWLVGLAIAAPVPASYWWIVVPMVALMQVVLPSLNGHGVREGGLILFLAEVGVAESTALTLGFLWFAVMATSSLFGGLVYLFGRFPRPEVGAEHDQPVRDCADQGRARKPAAAA
jgi:hypothetical protein